MATAAEARTAQRHRTRKAAILDAAAAEFARVGYENAKLDDIGKQVGLSRGSLYYYVESKEAIMAELFVRFTDEVQESLPDESTGTPPERLRSFILAHVQLASRTPHVAATAGNRSLYLSNTTSDELKVARRRHQHLLQTIITDGIEKGYFETTIPPRALTNLIFGAINTIPESLNLMTTTADVLASGTVELLLNGLSAKKN